MLAIYGDDGSDAEPSAGYINAATEHNEWIDQCLMVLEQIRDSGFSLRGWMIFRITNAILVTLMIIASSRLVNDGTERIISVAVACVVGFGALLILTGWAEKRYQRNTRRKLNQSGIIELLALGPKHLETIYRWTPWPWSYMLGLRPRRLDGWFRLLINNLDWYMAEPRFLLRHAWIVIVAGYVLLAVTFTMVLLAPRLGFTLLAPMVFTLIGQSWCHSFEAVRIRTNADCLYKHLWEQDAFCPVERNRAEDDI